MRENDISNATLANKLNITQATLWDRIDTKPRKNKPRKDIPVSMLSEMLKEMGYKVLIVPDDVDVPDRGYTIGSTANEKAHRIPLRDVDADD
jgi:biotin operon repressor